VEGSGLCLIQGICLEVLRKTTKTLSQNSRSPGRDLNAGPPEYKAEMLTTRIRHSAINLEEFINSLGLFSTLLP
jgi:hypothetical protein